MAALSNLLPLVIVFLLRIQQGSLAEEASATEVKYPRLIIEPDLKGSAKILKIGEHFSITCTFESKENDRHTKADELKWTDEWGTLVSSDSTKNEYSKTMSGKSRRMLLLVINAKALTDKAEGKKFICEAKHDNNVVVKNEVLIKIVDVPTWKNNEPVVTGRLGESLEINCEPLATSEGTHVDTIMMFENGTEFPTRYETPSSTRVFIKPLTMDERKAVIKCTALETHPEQDVVLTTEKIVKINLHFPPIFAQSDMTRYGIVGRKVTLPCQVADSNPRVSQYLFYWGEKQIGDNGVKYQIDEDRDQQTATLTINELADEDFEPGTYYCRVRTEDGQFDGEMKFQLQKAVPPSNPQVMLQKSTKSKVDFEIKEVAGMDPPNNPPVTHFEIRFINFNDIKDLNDVDRKAKLSESRPRIFNKTDSNVYTVDHLHWNTLYTFDIRAVNEAGNSDAFLVNTTTLEESAAEPMTGSAAGFFIAFWCTLATPVLLAMWYSTTEVSRH